MLTETDLENIGELIDTKLDKKLSGFGVGLEARLEAKIDTKIEELAIMVARGFEEAKKDLNEAKEELRDKMRDMKEELLVRIDHIEFNLHRNHDNRIEKLEDDMRIVKTDLGLT